MKDMHLPNLMELNPGFGSKEWNEEDYYDFLLEPDSYAEELEEDLEDDRQK